VSRLFIVGGSDAGISAALRARELAPEWRVSVAVADRYANFSICGIPYYLSKEVAEADSLAHRNAQEITASGVELLLDQRVEGIDTASRRAVVRDATGGIFEHHYDKLILATGARSIQPPIDGLNLPGVFPLRWMGDTLAFEDYLTSRLPKRIAIIGGGYIGLEMSEALTHRGMDVSIVEMAASIMATVDPDLSQTVADELRRNDVKVLTGQKIASITRVGEHLRLVGDDFSLAADMVLVAVGAQPETSLALAAGLGTGFKGALKVNRRMEASAPDVFAAGDCAETWHRITQTTTYLPLGTTAHKQGRIAGENAVGGDRLYEGSLGTQSVRLFDIVVARTGFHDRDAAKAGFAPLSVDASVWDHKVYYPGAHKMMIRLTGDRVSGQLLGAQIIGHYGSEVSKRLDIVATAIHHGMTVEQINDLDLSYTPPLSSPWDPVQTAAQAWTARRCETRD
jgi:NADPH-dependent 2,4-dienoyl-CoA reductase/sulfur reductase-like enzyme